MTVNPPIESSISSSLSCESNNSEDGKYVLFVSGIQSGNDCASLGDTLLPLDLSMQLLSDFVCGRLGGEHEIQLASKIVR